MIITDAKNFLSFKGTITPIKDSLLNFEPTDAQITTLLGTVPLTLDGKTLRETDNRFLNHLTDKLQNVNIEKSSRDYYNNNSLNHCEFKIGKQYSIVKDGDSLKVLLANPKSTNLLNEWHFDLNKDLNTEVSQTFLNALNNNILDADKTIRTVKDLKNLAGKKVFVRVDFNVPYKDGTTEIDNDNRIKAALPTIKYLIDSGAKVILASHLGEPKGADRKFTLAPVAVRLQELLKAEGYENTEVKYATDCIGKVVQDGVNSMKNGDVVLLENLRFHKGEKANDANFAKELASLGDIYVNDAFGAAHRGHASTSGMAANFNESVAGLLMEKEINSLGNCLKNPKGPFVAVVGGSKVSSKIDVLEKLMEKVNTLVIGGAMTFTFLKAQGKEVGKSLVENDQLETAKRLMDKANKKGVKIVLATDVVVAPSIDSKDFKTVPVDKIPPDMMGLDIGKETCKEIGTYINDANTVLWNGPMGVFENPNFAEGTKSVAQEVAKATKDRNIVSILGGGDTVSALEKFDIPQESFTHVSTGGGASLEFLEGKQLPGIACLDNVYV